MGDDLVSKVDLILDHALAGYSTPLPIGLEARVLAHVAQTESQRRRRKTLALAASALAASMLGLVLVHQKPVSLPAPSSPLLATALTRIGPKQMPFKAVIPRIISSVRGGRRRPLLLKADVFPSLTPMTNEERALVRFVQRSPLAAAEAFADLQNIGDKPISIEAINIVSLSEERFSSGEIR